MIVTSIRCYLNILTQLMSGEQLLTANYYIADLASATGAINLSDSVRYNEYGQIIQEPSVSSAGITALGRYNIKYDNGCLNPEPFRAQCLVGVADDYSSSYEKFVKHLNNPETMMCTYQFLFKEPLKGNGLQIVIFYDDQNLLEYGNIVCQYLSQNFGVDIMFIDPSYRPNCRGYAEYTGNKEFGMKTIHDIRDFELLFNFSQSVSASDMYGNVSNVSTFLSSFDFGQLIYLYNLLFPDDPLPPGNYSADHIRQVIIGRATAGISKNPLQNLTGFDWRAILDRYESETDSDDDSDYADYM